MNTTANPAVAELVAQILEAEGSKISLLDMIDETAAAYVESIPQLLEVGNSDRVSQAVRKHGMPTVEAVAAALREALA